MSHPELTDCVMCLPVAVGFLILRAIFERYIIQPLAWHLGLSRPAHTPATLCVPLEDVYRIWNQNVPPSVIQTLTLQTQCSIQDINRWFRNRKALDKAVIAKFGECGWHFLYYSCSFVGGVCYLWDKSWFWDMSQCWEDWPMQNVPDGVFWIYQIQMGFYLSLVYTVLFHLDSNRKDRTEMIVHHFVSLALIWASWCWSFMRVGTLVFLVHDMADPGLALAKMVWYSKRKETAEKIFLGAAVIWVISRLVLYPFRILKSTIFEAEKYDNLSSERGLFWVFNGLLGLLQLLNVMWTVSISRVMLQKFKHGKVQKDVRSDTEPESDSSDYEDCDTESVTRWK